MKVHFKGAITFEDDAALQAAMEEANSTIEQQADSILARDDLKTLGLHLTMSGHVDGNTTQVDNATAVITTLVSHAYSGYIDVTIDEEETRYHAKEIDPTPIEKIEEKMGLTDSD